MGGGGGGAYLVSIRTNRCLGGTVGAKHDLVGALVFDQVVDGDGEAAEMRHHGPEPGPVGRVVFFWVVEGLCCMFSF